MLVSRTALPRNLAALAVLGCSLALLYVQFMLQLSREYAARDASKAVQVLQLAESSLPQLSIELLEYQSELLLNNDPGLALESFRSAVSHRPIDPELWSRLSVAAFFAGETALAEDAARFALSLAPLSLSIALEQAAVGGQFASEVSSHTLTAWREAARFAGRADRNATIRYLIATRRGQVFCRVAGEDHELASWCAANDAYIELCQTRAPLSARVQDHCRKKGYLN